MDQSRWIVSKVFSKSFTKNIERKKTASFTVSPSSFNRWGLALNILCNQIRRNSLPSSHTHTHTHIESTGDWVNAEGLKPNPTHNPSDFDPIRCWREKITAHSEKSKSVHVDIFFFFLLLLLLFLFRMIMSPSAVYSQQFKCTKPTHTNYADLVQRLVRPEFRRDLWSFAGWFAVFHSLFANKKWLKNNFLSKSLPRFCFNVTVAWESNASKSQEFFSSFFSPLTPHLHKKSVCQPFGCPNLSCLECKLDFESCPIQIFVHRSKAHQRLTFKLLLHFFTL